MKLVKSFAALVLALSMTTSAMAADLGDCVTEAESAAMFASLMPGLIDGLQDKCAAHLPANAYLVQKGSALMQQYRALADQRWPEAKLAFGRMAGDEELAAELPDELLRPMLGPIVGSMILKDFKSEDCAGANQIVENLAPLPPENVAAMMAAIVDLAVEKSEEDAFRICKP